MRSGTEHSFFAANGRARTRTYARALAADFQYTTHPGSGGAPGGPGEARRGRPPLIAAPMRLEAGLISSAAPRLEVWRTGAGRRHARRRAASLALAAGNGSVLVLGFGGGLDPAGTAGEAVVGERIIGPDHGRLALEGAGELAAFLRAHGLPARAGTVASVTRPALGAARNRLFRAGALVADMESIWLLDSLPATRCAVVRIVADTPADGLWRPWRGLASFLRAARALRVCAAALEQWTGPGPAII